MKSNSRALKLISFIFAGLFFGIIMRLMENRKPPKTTLLPNGEHKNLPILLESIDELSLLDEIHPEPIKEIA